MVLFNVRASFKVLCVPLFLGFVACSHSPEVQDIAATASPTEELQKLDADMTAAQKEQVDILSPNNYEKAQTSQTDARHDLDKQKDSSKVLHEIAKSRAYLNQARAVAQVGHTNIEDVITARQQAISADAPKYFSKEFEVADRNFREIGEDMEKNNLETASKYRTSLQGQYLNLELVSIKAANLGDAQTTIEKSVKEGAKTYAPRTLAIAEKDFKDTAAFITANRHDEQVKAKSAATLESANHLLKITRDAKSGKKTSPEELALQMESEKNQVAAKNSQLQVKESELLNKNSQLANKDSELSDKNTQLTGAALALEETNRKANATKEFNQKYETARAQFSESEADVYKQGDDLVIRLKTLEFPKSKANLKASNFSVLAKVESVIKSFGDSSVTIEGHTDSVGGKEVNQKISMERAEAIKAYFVANSAAEPSKIKAVGYDYQKPLATNKTAAGRAQNRRVDIRIQPENSSTM